MKNEIDYNNLTPFSELERNHAGAYYDPILNEEFTSEVHRNSRVDYLKRFQSANAPTEPATKSAKQTATKRKKVAPVSQNDAELIELARKKIESETPPPSEFLQENCTAFAPQHHPEPTNSIEQLPDFQSATKRNRKKFAPFAVAGFTFSNADDLADNAKAPNYLINRILESDSHGILGGASMAFKTFVALRMAHSICTGKDFMGQKVYATGKVIYVCGEGQGALSRRIKALRIADSDFNGNLIVLNESLKIDNQADMARLKQAIDEINPVLVIFDTFASLVSDTDENSPSDVGRTLRLIKETCRNGRTSSMIIHHHGKDSSRGLRGASNFTNDVDFSLELTRHSDSMITTLSCKKMKDGESFKDISMEAQVVALGLKQQDGNETTSLVLVQSDYVPSTNKTGAKPLDATSQNILSAIYTAIEKNGEKPPQSIIDRFKDSPQNLPQMVVHIDNLRCVAYPFLSCAENSKRVILRKHLEKLENNYKSMFYDGYLWTC